MSELSLVNSDKYRVSAHLPAALLTWGSVEAVGSQILTAGAVETLKVKTTLAKMLPAGHSIEVWTHFVSDTQRPQIVASAEPAFFACNSDQVAITPFARPDAKVHGAGSFFPYRRYVGVKIDADAPADTTFTFTVANVSMQTYEETLFNLRIAILEGDTVVGYLGDAFYTVCGNRKNHLAVIAPTRVEAGELFDVKIVTRDRFGNKTGDPLVDLDFVLTIDNNEGAVAYRCLDFDEQWQHHIVRDMRLNEEGTYYLRMQLRDDDTVAGISNPIVVRNTWAERVYWGDMHQHAYYHDGRGTPAANYEYAISSSCLDFCAVAPHQEATFNPPAVHLDGAPPQTGWEEMQEAAAAYNGDHLVTILGSEAGSLGRFAGHMNAYYLEMGNRPELERLGLYYRSGNPINLFQGEPHEVYRRYLDELESSEGEILLLPHAHACGGPGKFELPVRPQYQTNVEICSVHGVFEAFYQQWLKHGHFVGVHGSGDNHMTSTGNGNPGWHYTNTNGLAAALASKKNRRGIWDAIKGRRTYAVTGNQRIHLDFAINTTEMGAIVADDSPLRAVHLEIAGTAPVMRIDLIRNNEIIHTYTPALERRDVLRIAWTDSWGSRRVDDSLTTGTITLKDRALEILERIHMFHRTDHIERAPENDKVIFRTNGYSGTTRGVLLRLNRPQTTIPLAFSIHDTHLDTVLLDETIIVDLKAQRTVVTRPLGDRMLGPCFTQEPYQPTFTLEVDWVDPEWPKGVTLDWTDRCETPAFYYVRVEQTDGNIAWSSPIWFLDQLPLWR